MCFRSARSFSATDLINAVCTIGTEGLVIIDCRTEAEQQVSAIPGAVQLHHVTGEHLKEVRIGSHRRVDRVCASYRGSHASGRINSTTSKCGSFKFVQEKQALGDHDLKLYDLFLEIQEI